MLRARVLIVALLLVASVGGGVAADRPGHIAFRHYTSDDGLSALDLVVGLQDREGFIWASSPNGLFRYDGVRFHRFSVEDGLPSTLVTDMSVAPDGVLWGATSRGLFYRNGDRFVAVGGAVLPVDGMHMLAFDAAGRTWITTNRGPFTVTGLTAVEPAPGWPGGEAFGILVDSDGTMLVGHGSRLVRRAQGSAVFEDAGYDFIETITNIVRDSAGRLWLRAGEHLWMQPHPGAPFVDRSAAYLGAPTGADGLRLALSARGTLLIPTSVGLIEVNGDDAHFVQTDLADDARSIKAVWVDREGSLWLASLGLHHELGRGLWRTISTNDGLPTNNVWSITGLRDGRVAVGTDAGVVILGGERPDALPTPSVVSAVEQPAGTLWIATRYKVVRYELATHQRVDLGPESGLPDRRLLNVASDQEGSVWVGYASGGLYRAQAAAEPRFERVVLPGSEDAMIGGIAVDQGRVWVTTSSGLHVRDRGVWHRFTTRDGLRDDGVMFLTARKDHEICVSYLAPYGLTCLRYADGAIAALRHIDTTNGLNSPVPYFVNEDAAGRLWVGGAQGVSIFDGTTVDHFTRASGAPGDDCNANASWAAAGGDVWIGTSSGVGLFDGARYRRPLAPPAVKLAHGHLGDVALDFDAPAQHSVPHDRARFDVELAALSYIDERHLEYQIRLVGFDDDWHAAQGGEVRYHRLPSGSYEFAARARYRDGTWGEPTIFAFVVETPFWKMWWFIAPCIAAGLGLVAMGVRWRLRALVRRNLELEETVRERTRDLVAANEKVAHAEKLSALGRLLAQLSHEIHNPLNVIHNNIAPLEEYSQELSAAVVECRDLIADRAQVDALWKRHDLSYILGDAAKAFAITKTAIKRVTDIHSELKAFLRKQPLEREPTDLAEVVRSTAAMMQRALPDVEFRFELEPAPLVLVHRGRINQTLTNLLQNAADSMKQNGRITIRVSSNDREVQIRVADTGPGITQELRSKIFEPFFTTKDVGQGLGLGLSICREIVVAHGGSLELDDGYADGACFVIALPRVPVAVTPAP
jgi:signal transduction histidine kinase/ligand-binding sensor domain-containing protein